MIFVFETPDTFNMALLEALDATLGPCILTVCMANIASPQSIEINMQKWQGV